MMRAFFMIMVAIVAACGECLAVKKGFGAPKKASAPRKAALSGKAKQLYKEHGGDLDSVQADLFGHYMGELRSRDPTLFGELVKAQSQDGSASEAGKEALVALTWDVVADCLPVMGGEDARLSSRLDAIAEGVGGRCLDVGCGDGSLVPHLARAGRLEAYVGVDVSGGMVRAARRKHPKRTFVKCGLSEVPGLEEAAGGFDAVLFVGSFQFFPDAARALADAAAVLRPGGAVVVAHARGGAFVREEARGHPVVRPMPTAADLGAAGAASGLAVTFAGDDLDAFYHVRLAKEA